MEFDPISAFYHADRASELGDPTALQTRDQIMRDHISPHGEIGGDRLRAVSSLICALEPVFAYHAPRIKKICKSGFNKLLIGSKCILQNFTANGPCRKLGKYSQ